MGSAADQPHDGDALAQRLDELLARINADELVLDEGEAPAGASEDESPVATEVSPELDAEVALPESTEAEAHAAIDETVDGPGVAAERANDRAPEFEASPGDGGPIPDAIAQDEPPTPTEVGDAAIDAAESLTADIASLTADIDALINAGGRPADDAPAAERTSPTPADVEESAPSLEDSDDATPEDLEELLAEVVDSAVGATLADAVDEPDPLTAPDADGTPAPDGERPRGVDEASAEISALLDESLGMEASGLDGEAPIDQDAPEGEDDASVPEPVTELEPVVDAAPPIAEDDPGVTGEEIDDELAALSEALLTTEDDVSAEAPEPIAPAGASGESVEAVTDVPDETEAPEAEVAPASAPWKTSANTEPKRAPGRVRAIVEPIVAKAAPVAATALLAASKPLEDRPARIRHTVGWMAVYTAFMAACVWVFIAVRSPVPPENAGGASVEIAKPESSGAGVLEATP